MFLHRIFVLCQRKPESQSLCCPDLKITQYITQFTLLSKQLTPEIHNKMGDYIRLMFDMVIYQSDHVYSVGQIKWHHFTFLLVTNECINKISWFLAQINYIKQQMVWCQFYVNKCVTRQGAPRVSLRVRLIQAANFQRKSHIPPRPIKLSVGNLASTFLISRSRRDLDHLWLTNSFI